jgi:carbamoyltransferase
MLRVAPVREQHRTRLPPEERKVMQDHPDLRHRVNVVRSPVPAITHLDYSAGV